MPEIDESEIDATLRQFGLRRRPAIPERAYACPVCKDAAGGWYTVPDGGAGRAVRCQCQENPPEARIESRLVEMGLNRIDIEGSRDPWRTIINGVRVDAWPKEVGPWFESALAGAPKKSILLLWGPPGRGKSKLAAMLLRRWLKEKFLSKAMWAYWSRALRGERRDIESDLEDRMYSAGFLVIDDASKGMGEFGLDVFERVVDTRQGNYLPTVITMNLPPGMDPDETFRATLASRLQRAVIVEFVGQLDIRGAV